MIWARCVRNNPFSALADEYKEDDDHRRFRRRNQFDGKTGSIGGVSCDDLLDWIISVEEFLDFKKVLDDRRVPLVAIRFRGHAVSWWSKLKSTRTHTGKEPIQSWERLKKHLRKTIFPQNFDRSPRLSLHWRVTTTVPKHDGSIRSDHCFRGTSLDVHLQSAVPFFVEQLRLTYTPHGSAGSSSNGRVEGEYHGPIFDNENDADETQDDILRTAGDEADIPSLVLMMCRPDTTPINRDNQWLRINIFRSSCLINDKICSIVTDSGSSRNVVVADAIHKLEIPAEAHPVPYSLSWV
ncbi:unnamed protein product [Microthlaspi erraticum]|uniref:Retrotransposon gag domain-containing protein n=1 Tax=Microthlaspi erraticum TaxID=1685480 RepID=A0A6D2IG68_9BRAS|nr:unnamed protein product [Microthlaspi erraticum]